MRPPAAPAAAKLASSAARITVLRGTSPGATFRLGSSAVEAGAAQGALLFPDDPFLSPLHATFFFRDSHLFVRDEGGPSGTFVRIRGPEGLQNGSYFAVGDHLVRFSGPLIPPPMSGALPYGAPVTSGALYCLEQIYEGGSAGRACARAGPVLTVGRIGCDLNFPTDALVQARHCEVLVDAMGATLRDLGGPEGTFVRLAPGAERGLVPGDAVRIGLEVLRIETA